MKIKRYLLPLITVLLSLSAFQGCSGKSDDIEIDPPIDKNKFNFETIEDPANTYGFDKKSDDPNVHISLKADMTDGKTYVKFNIPQIDDFKAVVARSSDPSIFVLTSNGGPNNNVELTIGENSLTLYSNGNTGIALLEIVGINDIDEQTIISGCAPGDPSVTCKENLFVHAYTERLIPSISVYRIYDPAHGVSSAPADHDMAAVLEEINDICKQPVVKATAGSVTSTLTPVSFDYNGNQKVEYYEMQMWKGYVVGTYLGEYEAIYSALSGAGGNPIAYVKDLNVAYELTHDYPAGSISKLELYSNNGLRVGETVKLWNGTNEINVNIKEIKVHPTTVELTIDPISGPLTSRQRWTLAGNVSPGASTIYINDATGLNVNDRVLIGPPRDDGTTEEIIITAINTSATPHEISIASPVKMEHPSTVVTRNHVVSTTAGNQTSSITIDDVATINWLFAFDGIEAHVKFSTISEGGNSEEFLSLSSPSGNLPIAVTTTDLQNLYTNAAVLSSPQHLIQKPVSYILKSLAGLSTFPVILSPDCTSNVAGFAETISHEMFHLPSLAGLFHSPDTENLMYPYCAGGRKLIYRSFEEIDNEGDPTGNFVNQWDKVIR
jgi:hypothetical protein